MTTQFTPIYQIPWPQSSDPIKQTAGIMELQAKKLEQVLQNGSFPSSIPTTADITARLSALENVPLVNTGLVTTDQVIGTAASGVPVTWNARSGDTAMNPTTNSGTRLVAPKNGYYELSATLVFSNVSGGMRSVGFNVVRNGVTTFFRGSNNMAPSASFFTEVSSSVCAYVLAGEYFVVCAEVQTAASSVSVKAGQNSRACLKYIRATA